MIKIACGCQKNRAGFDAAGNKVGPSTYRVMVSGRQVYESSSKDAAEAVAARFDLGVTNILAPGQV